MTRAVQTANQIASPPPRGRKWEQALVGFGPYAAKFTVRPAEGTVRPHAC